MYVHIIFVACSSGYYGELCQETCGNCSDGVTCNNVNGTCTNGCDVGVYGDKCKTRMSRIDVSFFYFYTKYQFMGPVGRKFVWRKEHIHPMLLDFVKQREHNNADYLCMFGTCCTV
jgi:hypothetical protein